MEKVWWAQQWKSVENANFIESFIQCDNFNKFVQSKTF